MIHIKNITKNILGEPLFTRVTFSLNRGDKVGIVGPNGSGKSTLMKILLGEIDADDGSVDMEKERIGYLSQALPDDIKNTNLSGGQKTRLALENILSQNPTALFLDEPTNHLDVTALEWLETIIREFKGIVLIISHDRTLLDNSVNKILEIDSVNKTFNQYHGGYTVYRKEKENKLQQLEEEYTWQQKEKKRLEEWLVLKRQDARIRPDPAKGKQIRAMEKRLEREIYSQELVKPKEFRKIKGMELAGENPEAKLILRCTNIHKKYADKNILWDITMEVRGQERVVLAGVNGSGKTTLLKILTGEITADKGVVKIGEKVKVGYFSQEHENLQPNNTVLEEFMNTERLVTTEREPRAILGAFLFTGEDVFKKIRDLSLGEKVRLIFAQLTNQANELLILDEPTNHLDIGSREIIENALLDYKGAIIVVSHDRYFVEKINPTRILTIRNNRFS